MEPISLVLAALVAGAAKGAGQTAAGAVQDAYRSLRDLLSRRLAGKPAAADAVEQYTQDPQAWKDNVVIHLRQVGAGEDRALIDAAERVMQLADPAGASSGKYAVNLAGAQGVQVGDGNEQTNYFGPPPRGPVA